MNLLLTATLLEGQAVFLKSSLIILYLILAALALSCLVFTFIMVRSPMEGTAPKILMVLIYLVTAFVLISTIICTDKYNKLTQVPDTDSVLPQITTTAPPEETTESTTTPAIVPGGPLTAYHTADTDPANWNIKWDVMQNSNVLQGYIHPDQISFGDADSYTAQTGVTAFRGNHFRNSASYGFVNIVEQTISVNWDSDVGTHNGMTGCGWTGQPLIVRWDASQKTAMNLKDDKKAKADLKEVIYATLDGNIYFYDLDDGSYTRDPISLGMNFTCSGSLDPRGYPLLYLGASDGESQTPRIYVISLIDGSVLYEQNGTDIDAYYRQYSFDSAPIVNAQTDTLIWPSESGIIYFLKLNTVYTQETGSITIKPENVIKLRYKTEHLSRVGAAASPVMADHYLYYADCAGMVLCIDLRTMSLVWAQDTGDTIHATPVFHKNENGEAHLYTATASVNDRTLCRIYKLDARTGQIIWEYTAQNVHSSTTIPGGVLASPILGKVGTTLDGMIIFNIARTPNGNVGTLLALDTATGSPVWEQGLAAYSWSSPAALYTAEGIGYIVSCDSQGNVTLHEGATGNLLSSQNVGLGIDASPAVFENTIVVGTTGEKVYSFQVG